MLAVLHAPYMLTVLTSAFKQLPEPQVPLSEETSNTNYMCISLNRIFCTGQCSTCYCEV